MLYAMLGCAWLSVLRLFRSEWHWRLKTLHKLVRHNPLPNNFDARLVNNGSKKKKSLKGFGRIIH